MKRNTKPVSFEIVKDEEPPSPRPRGKWVPIVQAIGKLKTNEALKINMTTAGFKTLEQLRSQFTNALRLAKNNGTLPSAKYVTRTYRKGKFLYLLVFKRELPEDKAETPVEKKHAASLRIN